MSGRPLITRVVLENYKSIAFCDVKLGPLSILVGPNGAGKSNFLDALRFLSEAMNGPIDKPLQNRDGFPNVVRRGSMGHVGVRVEFVVADGLKGYYSLRIMAEGTNGCKIDWEKCAIGPAPYEIKDGIPRSPIPLAIQPHQRGLLYLPYMAADARYSKVFSLLSNCRFYNFSPKDIHPPVRAGHVERLLRVDGANLANVLDSIRLEQPSTFHRIIQYLTGINPAVASMETVEFGGFRALEFLMHGQTGSFAPRQVSDGTLRSLALLTALFQTVAGANDVSLIGIEEPEGALHPAAAGVLFDALREASASVQVIATTHSADLLDKKEIDTESVLAVEMEDGITRIGHVNNTGRQALKERLYTAGELMRMNYLIPESGKTPDDSEMESLLFGDPVSA